MTGSDQEPNPASPAGTETSDAEISKQQWLKKRDQKKIAPVVPAINLLTGVSACQHAWNVNK